MSVSNLPSEEVVDLSPFKAMVMTVGTLPTAFTESMTYYEALAYFVQYLNTVINVVDQNAEATKELQKLFVELHNYVEHYFDNLDVQEEIDNKLDAMAEGGQLASIIAQFLEMSPVFGYDTISAMAAADNLSNGSIARILGKTSAATGNGCYYKVRTRIESDNPDGDNLVAIGDTLVAVKIPDYFLNQETSAREAADSNLQDQIDNLVTPPKKYIFISDSYGGGWTPDGTVTGWIEILVDMLGLESSQYITSYEGGYAFGRSSEYNFITLLNNIDSDNDVTDIIVGGGYNDRYSTEIAITEGIAAFANLAKTKFPNATVHIAFMGWSKNGDAKSDLRVAYQYYKNACDAKPDVRLISNIQYTLHDYFNCWASDGYHPNATGHQYLAKNMYKYLTQGHCDVSYDRPLNSITFVNSGGATGTWESLSHILNDTTTLIFSSNAAFAWSSGNEITISGKSLTEIGTLGGGVMVGDETESCCASTPSVCQLSDNTYRSIPLTFIIKNGKLYVRSNLINSAHTNFDSYTVKAIQFGAVNITVNSMFA